MNKVLIVDDESEIVELLANRLTHNGYDTLSASDGVEALVKVQDEQPDFIILDVSMPQMDGYLFAKEMRWHPFWKNIPIMVLTAKNKTQTLFENLGIYNFMTKPFDSNDVLSRINAHFNQKSLQKHIKHKIVVISPKNNKKRSFMRHLKHTSFNLFSTTNSEKGLNLVTKHHPDLIIIDDTMPKVSDLAIWDIIKINHHFEHIPLIILTSEKNMSKSNHKFKADAIMKNSADEQALIAKIHDLLKGDNDE